MNSATQPSDSQSLDVGNTSVSQIMTEHVETIGYSETVAEALKLMAEDGRSTLPVVDEENRCVGMLSRSDLTEMFLMEDRELSRHLEADGALLSILSSSFVDTCDEKRVRELMSHNVKTIGPGANIKEACKLMAQHDFHHLPVVNDEGQIVGFVSSFDIIQWMSKE